MAYKKFRKTSGVKKNRLSGPRPAHIALALLALSVAAVSIYFISAGVSSAFRLKKTIFIGNIHLTDDELRNLAGIKGGENLLTLSGGMLFEKMTASPWIKNVSIRKEIPDTLRTLITETEAFALLDMNGRLFIVNDSGKLLEELKGSAVPFLPIIMGDPFGEKEAFAEAIHLVKEIKNTGLLQKKDHIEIIAHKPQEMSVNLDGTVVKIGVGEYADKLARFIDLETEIKSRRIPVDYIDLRFANRVVVKPINEVIR